MSLQIKSSSADQVILERANSGSTKTVFLIVGSIFTLVGLVMLLLMPWEFPFLIFKLVFPSIGIFVVYTAFTYDKNNKKTTLSKVVFDNKLGCVALELSDVEQYRGYIKYEEIEKFGIYIETHSSSKGHKTYYYHTVLYKKDGGEWFLTKHSTENEANEDLQKLRANVNLSQIYIANFSPVFSNKLEKKEGLNKTSIFWQNEVKLATVAFLVGFGAIFCSILYAVVKSMSFKVSFEIFPIIICGFIFIVFGIIMFSIIKQLIKDATTKYSIAVSHSSFDYLELDKKTSEVKLSKSIPLDQLYSIVYNYWTKSNNQPNKLIIFNKEGYDKLISYRNNPNLQFEALANQFKENLKQGVFHFDFSYSNQIELVFATLNPIECLQLETWLQEIIKSKNQMANVL